MKRFYIACAALFFVTQLHAEPAQLKPLKVESIKFVEKTGNSDSVGDVVLPFVSSTQPKIAKKINDYLFITIASTLAPSKAGDGIKRNFSKEDDDPMAGVSSLNYKVVLNDGKLLTLHTQGEFCAAYCEGFSSNYSFDTVTGRHITLQDLLTESGIQALKQKVYAARVATMQQTIKRSQKQSLKKTVKHKKTNDDDEFEHDAEDEILLYQTCLTENAETHKDEMKSGDLHELDYFSIDANSVSFTHERCSNHAARALDQIDEFKNSYTFQSLKPFLTPYARYLLLSVKGPFKVPTGISEQVFYGNIGPSKITFLVKPAQGYDRMLRAVYFYDKYRQPIELSGTGSTWTEINSTNKPQPEIKANWQADTLSGQWQGDGKTLSFKITP
ncbi:MAG: hypothetical protein H7Z20_10535 [Bdellovibrio sp.]|nr:hypothetical protein [Methylotenera sp.]